MNFSDIDAITCRIGARRSQSFVRLSYMPPQLVEKNWQELDKWGYAEGKFIFKQR